MATFSSALTALAAPLAKKVLNALGIGILTFVGVETGIRAALNLAKANFAGISADVAQVIAMSGLFTAMGIIAGGIMAGVSLMITSKLARLT